MRSVLQVTGATEADHDVAEQMRMEPDVWIEGHRGELEEISRRHQSDERLAVGLTTMILHGYSDEEILTDLGHEILVWDGQRNPLAHIEGLLADLRQAVIES